MWWLVAVGPDCYTYVSNNAASVSADEPHIVSAMDGEWELVSMLRNGETASLPKIVIELKDGNYRSRGNWIGNFTVKDNTYTLTEAVNQSTYLGIYKIQGDIMWSCAFNTVTEDYPKEFRSSKDYKTNLIVWRRVNK